MLRLLLLRLLAVDVEAPEATVLWLLLLRLPALLTMSSSPGGPVMSGMRDIAWVCEYIYIYIYIHLAGLATLVIGQCAFTPGVVMSLNTKSIGLSIDRWKPNEQQNKYSEGVCQPTAS